MIGKMNSFSGVRVIGYLSVLFSLVGLSKSEELEVKFENKSISEVAIKNGWALELVGETIPVLTEKPLKIKKNKDGFFVEFKGKGIERGWIEDGNDNVICAVNYDKEKSAIVVPHLVRVTIQLPKALRRDFGEAVLMRENESGMIDVFSIILNKETFVRSGPNLCVLHNLKGEEVGEQSTIEIPKVEKFSLAIGIVATKEEP